MICMLLGFIVGRGGIALYHAELKILEAHFMNTGKKQRTFSMGLLKYHLFVFYIIEHVIPQNYSNV